MFPEETNQTNTSNSTLPLNWHKVQLYGLFFAVALIYIASSIPFFTNSFYGKYTEYIYNVCEPLKAIDTLFGILSLAYAAFLIYVRFQLAQNKEKAVFYMDIAYMMPGVLSGTYQLFSSLVIHNTLNMTFSEAFDIFSVVLFLLGSAIAGILNHIYYSKRYYLFTEEE